MIETLRIDPRFCGPDRAAGDGLRILPGISGDLVLAPWEPDASLADDAGRIAPEFVWGALDCTSSFPLLEDEAAQALEPMVLGRLAVAQTGDLYAGKRAVVTAWSISVEGRRGVSGSAVFDDSGTQVAVARATWVSLAGR